MDPSELKTVSSFFLRHGEEIRFWFSLALDGAKVSVILGTCWGLFIVVAYLHSVGAPLPITDVSATLAFLVIAAAYAFIAFMLVATLYSPAIVCAVPQRDRQTTGLRALDPNLSRRQKLEVIASYYILFHGSPLAVIAVMICGEAIATKFSSWYVASWPIAAIAGGAVSVLWLYHHPKTAQVEIKKSLKAKAARTVLCGSIKRSFWCLIWVVTIMSIAQALLPPGTAWLLVGVGVLVGYCFLAVGTTISRYLIVVVAVAMLLGVSNAAYWGRTSLHFLGIGGGIPVAILVKDNELETHSMVGPNMEGCLIINTGGRFVIWPMQSPKEAACRNLSPKSMPGGVPALSRVVMLSQTDILQINGTGRTEAVPK